MLAKEMSVKTTTMPIARALEIDGNKAITASNRAVVDHVFQSAKVLLKPHESNNSIDGIMERWWQLRVDQTRVLIAGVRDKEWQ